MVLLRNFLAESQTTPGCWSVVDAADRWRGIRTKLDRVSEAVDEDSQETLEQLCFVVDESLRESAVTGGLASYADALQEVSDVLLSEMLDVSLQMLVAGELQKLALPS